MTNTMMMTSTMGDDQFYPTPGHLAGKMVAGIDWSKIETILEPSAGKGDLLMAAAKAFASNSEYDRKRKGLDADCIEIDPYLQQILAYNFSDESISGLRESHSELDRKRFSLGFTHANKEALKKLNRQIEPVQATNMRIVHDDFLTFRGQKKYDLILMNPPFAEGDRHLLKALELQKNGGCVVCLLNAETLRNVRTKTRQLLQQKLQKYGAKITFVPNAFKDAERTADVDVAIVRVIIQCDASDTKSDIYERMKKAAEQEYQEHEHTALISGGFIEQLVQQFDIEVASGLGLIREYEAMRPYILDKIPTESNSGSYSKPILTLCVGDKTIYSGAENINRYLKATRWKYWYALLNNDKITGKLTNKLQQEYRESVDKMQNYDFSLFNIQKVIAEINCQIFTGVKESIMELFDRLTAEHSWYPESKKNIHYFNGWATNKAHKISKKSIIPGNGVFSSYSWKRDSFDEYHTFSLLSDVEKVFNYLDGRMTEDVDLRKVLRTANAIGQTKNIQCKYFKVDFYKKGTVHIKYTDQAIIDRLNIYAAQSRNWLPPYYGKVDYADMPDDAKVVIDDFQGEKAYGEVMANKVFYLADVGSVEPVLMLTEQT